jgi:hypothetical protein
MRYTVDQLPISEFVKGKMGRGDYFDLESL